ncbi:MAG: LacI family DNA-binding transcriptional regulator [Fusobacteriaceae bacterium]
MTIKDVARNLDLSVATISRAINGTGKIKEETKNKILDYIKKVEYTPNAIARNLSTKDARNIAILVPNISNPFFSTLVNCISQKFNDKKYNITLYNTNENREVERSAIRNIAEQRVSAVIAILMKSNYTNNPLKRILNLNVPCFLVDRDLENYLFDGVFLNNFKGSYNITKKLLGEGHKNIGIISGSDEIISSKERLEGYKKAFAENKLKVEQKFIYKGDFDFITGQKGVKKLLQENITALYAINNQIFLGALKEIISQKKQLRLACFEEVKFLDILGYDILSCKIPVDEIADNILDIFENKKNGKIYIEPNINYTCQGEL